MKKKGFFLRSTIFSVLILSLILCVTFAFGAVFCVKNATELQEALTTAAANNEDDTIQMVQGLYSGPFLSYTLSAEGLALEGGYTEGCASREIDPENTILDGGGINRCLAIHHGGCDISIEGVTFQNGKAPPEYSSIALPGRGGGLFAATLGGLFVTNSLFTGNTASQGGGAYIVADENLVCTNNTFSGNTVTDFHGVGGGLEVLAGSATLTNNTFEDNRATGYGGYGGGLYFTGSATLKDNVFTGNAAVYDEDFCAGDSAAEYTDRIGPTWSNGYGGGAYLIGPALLINNAFTDNSSAGHNRGRGGGVYISGSALLSNNIFERNTCDGYRDSGGGGVHVYGSATLTRNRFMNNTGPDSSSLDDSGGGGVHVVGSATLADNLFAENTSNLGGAVYIRVSDDSAALTNNTLTANVADTEGGGVWLWLKNDGCQGFLYNNIIWNNTAPEAADIYVDNTGEDALSPAQTDLYNNDFDQSSRGIHLAVPFQIDSSNLNNEDPLFVENGDYHLTEFSPCVDAGNNDAPDLPGTDMDGNPRIVNGTVDMGAYEYRTSVSAPKAITGLATSVSLSGAMLNGLVNPNGAPTTVVFEYGTDTSYGSIVKAAQSLLNGTDDHDVNADLTRLIPNTTYQFRVKATNSLGTTFGDNRSFSTKGPASLKPCYQFYNSTWVDHHFTIDEEEAALLKDNPEWGWEYVEISWYALPESEAGEAESAVGGLEIKPCHQFFNPTWVDHHFTIDEEEATLLKDNPQWGWEYVGISWYALPKSEAGRAEFVVSGFELKPCYQFYNPTWVDHHFTIDEDETALLKANPQWGWEYIGISWYVYEKPE